jgi:hypothetical protein
MEDLETVIPAPEVIDDAELPSTTLMVAGVDASAESLAAAHYAVRAAELRGNDVLLVHAYPPVPPGPGGEAAAGRATADELLAGVVAQLIVAPDTHVYTKAEQGDALSEGRSVGQSDEGTLA